MYLYIDSNTRIGTSGIYDIYEFLEHGNITKGRKCVCTSSYDFNNSMMIGLQNEDPPNKELIYTYELKTSKEIKELGFQNFKLSMKHNIYGKTVIKFKPERFDEHDRHNIRIAFDDTIINIDKVYRTIGVLGEETEIGQVKFKLENSDILVAYINI